MNARLDDGDLLQDFLAEAGELLDDVDQRLVELEHRPGDAQLLNRVFRGFHTVKGGAGFLDAAALVELCHKAENLLDGLRAGAVAPAPGVMDAILAATAEVRRMFGEMASGRAPAPAPATLLGALAAAAAGGESPRLPDAPSPAGAEPDWRLLHEALAGPAATPRAPVAPRPQELAETTIRVDTGRFDRILNLAGEIGLTRNRLAYLRHAIVRGTATEKDIASLDLGVNRLGALVTDLQAVVMKARMQPVGRVFRKYQRLARDLARSLGKEIDLTLRGEETEIDKTILDELNDPLVHLVRNAVDHGIEPPAERAAAGKPRAGAIEILARQEGDHILVEIRDDGRGMSAARLRDKAVERGLVAEAEAAALDERQSLALVFLPGLSTRDTISDVSGRGVGMDVVRTNIARLKGRVEIDSRPGEGCRVTIVLPLTLAILPVLMLRSGGDPYALPLSSVREVIAVDEAAVQRVAGRPALTLRGEVLPVLDLGDFLGGGGPGPVGIVATIAGRTVVLRADAVLGQDEVMVKPLEGIKPRGIAGATVSPEGVLVPVLELQELVDAAREPARPAAGPAGDGAEGERGQRHDTERRTP